jgi:outer membrane receptor protein involved in Fe transport
MRSSTPALAIAAIALAIAVPATAQTTPPQPVRPTTSRVPQPPPMPTVSEKVEVVVSKVPKAPHEVPASVEVITGDDLRNIGATTLREALALAAGVEIAPGGDAGPAGAVPEFWGLREFDAFLLVVDDVPWGGAFNPALPSLSLRDVERIEILRGAAAVTYGATSFVGVIHVVHKAASADTNYASARLGTLSSGAIGVDLAMPSRAGWNSRLTADFERQGFKDDRTSYGRGHALWRSSRQDFDRRMWFTADVNILRQSPASPHPRTGPVLSPDVPLDANHNPANSGLDENRVAIGFGTERPFLQDVRLGVTASYTHTSQDLFRGFLRSVSNTTDNAVGLREKIGVHDLYVDAHLLFPEQDEWRFIAGADFLHGSGVGRGTTFLYSVPLAGVPATSIEKPNVFDLRSENRREFLGGYGLAEWTASPRLTVSAGLRLNMTFEEGGEGESGDDEGANGSEDGATHVRFTSSVGALYRLWERGSDHVRVFGDFRNTFKPAAFDFGLGRAAGEEGEGALLDPETAVSVEGGVKARVMDGLVDLEASVFRLNFANLVTATIVDGLPALTNTGKTRFQGFDLAGDLRLRHAIVGRLTYSFHDATFVDFEQEFDGVPTQLAGNRFEMSARHLFSFGVVVAPESGIVGSLIVKHTGDRFLNKRNSALAEPFTVVDFGLGYRFDQYELRLDGRNVGDRRDPVAESELGDAQYYRLFPREFRITVGMRF